MTRTLRPRKIARLPESLHQQLNMYAIAASAAGVGVLASIHPAEAKIIYTPAHEKIVKYITVDLNHDGKNDFALRSSSFTNGGFHARYLAAFATHGNLLVGEGSYASALTAGVKIGLDQKFVFRRGLMAYWNSHGNRYAGQWINGGKGVKNRYLGIKFLIKGKIHFGWARLTVSPTKNFQGTLTGYAYETIPEKAIVAGATKEPDDAEPTAALNRHTSEPATLGALALGAPGLSIWRREESVGTSAFR